MTLIQLWPVSVTRGGQHSSIDNIAHLLVECCIKTRCVGLEKLDLVWRGQIVIPLTI